MKTNVAIYLAFHNKHHHTYSCPALIRANVTTVLLEDDWNMTLIADSWRPIYWDFMGQMANGTYIFCDRTQQSPCALT